MFDFFLPYLRFYGYIYSTYVNVIYKYLFMYYMYVYKFYMHIKHFKICSSVALSTVHNVVQPSLLFILVPSLPTP